MSKVPDQRLFLYCSRCNGIACTTCACAATGTADNCTKCGHGIWGMKFPLSDVVRVAEDEEGDDGDDEPDTDFSEEDEEDRVEKRGG